MHTAEVGHVQEHEGLAAIPVVALHDALSGVLVRGGPGGYGAIVALVGPANGLVVDVDASVGGATADHSVHQLASKDAGVRAVDDLDLPADRRGGGVLHPHIVVDIVGAGLVPTHRADLHQPGATVAVGIGGLIATDTIPGDHTVVQLAGVERGWDVPVSLSGRDRGTCAHCAVEAIRTPAAPAALVKGVGHIHKVIAHCLGHARDRGMTGAQGSVAHHMAVAVECPPSAGARADAHHGL